MPKLAIWAQLNAKAGKEEEVEKFLKSAQPLADDSGHNAHLNGEIAKTLFAKAVELFAEPPEIHKLEILAAKVPGVKVLRADA